MQHHYAKNPDGLVLSVLDERNVDEPAQQIQMTFEHLEQEDVHLPAAFGSKSQDSGDAVNIPVKFDSNRKALTTHAPVPAQGLFWSNRSRLCDAFTSCPSGAITAACPPR